MWAECTDTSHKVDGIMIYSSNRVEFKFAADYGRDIVVTFDKYVGVGCKGQPNADRESFIMRYNLGANLGANVFAFDMVIFNNDKESGIQYSSAKIRDQKLIVSLGSAIESDSSLGNGASPAIRYKFLEAKDGDKNLLAYYLTKVPE